MPLLLHFLAFGAFEGRKPNPLFDPEFYLQRYSDVAEREVNPLLHYLKFGAVEGRKPHPIFPGRSLSDFLQALEQSPGAVLYEWWRQQERHGHLPAVSASPRFSLLVPIVQADLEWLPSTIASVTAQSYPHWELHICCNSESENRVMEYVNAGKWADGQVHVMRGTHGEAVAVALNGAAARSTGDYVAVLEQDARLAPDALHWLATKAPADLIYSDEDLLDAAGARIQPLFKPDWSPELLLSCMYLGRIMAVSSEAWAMAGGLRAEGNVGEYSLALGISENTRNIQHVPRILYSRRGDGRQYLHGKRQNSTPSGEAMASIIICSRSPQLLERCLASVAQRTSYKNREIIVVQHVTRDLKSLQEITTRYGAVGVLYGGPFHFSRMNNLGVHAAKGAVLAFLNDDIEVLDSSWLTRLVAQSERPQVGVVGARLLYPSGRLQHGGIAIGIAQGCAHIGRNMLESPSHWPWLDFTRDVSAVTGACMAMRATVFHEVSGFSEEFPVNYNDIDLCLRVRERGYSVIYEAGAVLCHYECQSRTAAIAEDEFRKWQGRWGQVLACEDPFYNPNLTRYRDDLSLGQVG
jgi:GT2 family glycosyltransferase